MQRGHHLSWGKLWSPWPGEGGSKSEKRPFFGLVNEAVVAAMPRPGDGGGELPRGSYGAGRIGAGLVLLFQPGMALEPCSALPGLISLPPEVWVASRLARLPWATLVVGGGGALDEPDVEVPRGGVDLRGLALVRGISLDDYPYTSGDGFARGEKMSQLSLEATTISSETARCSTLTVPLQLTDRSVQQCPPFRQTARCGGERVCVASSYLRCASL